MIALKVQNTDSTEILLMPKGDYIPFSENTSDIGLDGGISAGAFIQPDSKSVAGIKGYAVTDCTFGTSTTHLQITLEKSINELLPYAEGASSFDIISFVDSAGFFYEDCAVVTEIRNDGTTLIIQQINGEKITQDFFNKGNVETSEKEIAYVYVGTTATSAELTIIDTSTDEKETTDTITAFLNKPASINLEVPDAFRMLYNNNMYAAKYGEYASGLITINVVFNYEGIITYIPKLLQRTVSVLILSPSPRATSGENDLGTYAFSIGIKNTARGPSSFAGGTNSRSLANWTFVFGESCLATINGAIALGYYTQSHGLYSYTEGVLTQALAQAAHAEGQETIASGEQSHAQGYKTKATANQAHAEGNGTEATAQYAHAEGINTQATALGAHAEGNGTQATGTNAHAECRFTIASGKYAHSEGSSTKAEGVGAHAEGGRENAAGNTLSKRTYGEFSIVGSFAFGINSHAEGVQTLAAERGAHSEGIQTNAIGIATHTEGNCTTATGKNAHAEGDNTQAFGLCAHSEGSYTQANGAYSHAGGRSNRAENEAETAIGCYNEYVEGALLSIGNGKDKNNRSNAFVVLRDGTIINSYIKDIKDTIGTIDSLLDTILAKQTSLLGGVTA